MHITTTARYFLSLSLLYSSIIFTSQLPENSPLVQLNVPTTIGQTLAEQHAWYLHHYEHGPVPQISANQLGQQYIRHPNTPVPDDAYDSMYVNVAALRKAKPDLPIPEDLCVRICSINYESNSIDTHRWILLKYLPVSLMFPKGSKQNPHTIE